MISLDEYIKEAHLSLDKFKIDYEEKMKEDPEGYYKEMEEDLWLEFLLIFLGHHDC